MSRLHISDSGAGRRHALWQSLSNPAFEARVATDMSEVWADFARQARQLMNCGHGLAEDGFATYSGWWEAAGLLGTVAAISVKRDRFIVPKPMGRCAELPSGSRHMSRKASPSSEP